MSKRGWWTLGVVVLLGIWLMVVGYEFLEKENALWQKKVKAAKEELRRCEARYARYKHNQSRSFIALPLTPDMWARTWTDAFNRVHAGQNQAEVEATLGEPGYTRCDVNKAGDKFEGSVWQYAIVLPPGAANDSQNNAIEILFGPDGKVKDKSMMNVQPQPSPSPSVPAALPTASGTATPGGTASPMALPEASATPAASASPTPQ